MQNAKNLLNMKKLFLPLAALMMVACGEKKPAQEEYLFGPDSLAMTRLKPAAEDTLDLRYGTTLLPLGTEAPDIARPVCQPSEGEDSLVEFSQLKGTYVVLDFWASWCPDCRREIPEVKRLEATYPIAFLGISFDTDRAQLQAAIDQYELTYPQAMELCRPKDSRVAQDYGVRWIPSYYLISPDGRVLLGTTVLSRLERALEQVIK